MVIESVADFGFTVATTERLIVELPAGTLYPVITGSGENVTVTASELEELPALVEELLSTPLPLWL